MITKTFYGNFQLQHFVQFLAAAFRDQNLDVRVSRHGEKNVVRFVSSRLARSGGHFGLNLVVTEFNEGVKIEISNPENFGVAASLGKTAIAAMINPRNLFSRLDDVAQDLENISLDQNLMKMIEQYMRSNHLTLQLSEALSRSVCDYCQVANEYGVGNCVACGAPMGDVQAVTCKRCGHVVNKHADRCSQCGAKL